jgi:signal transduction histidine kinase
MPEPVALAAYFVTSEALANAAKHARATQATVRVTRPDGQVIVEITDDGLGGADPSRGTGLRDSATGWRRSAAACGSKTDLRAEQW